MPGLLGCIRLSPSASSSLRQRFAEIIADIPLQGAFRSEIIVDDNEVLAAVFGPRITIPNLGAGKEGNERPLPTRVGYYGEFFGPSFNNFEPRFTTENLLKIYNDNGEKIAEKLDGSYSIFLWSPKNFHAMLFHDLTGSRPIFYAQRGGYLLFAPEPKILVRVTQTRFTMDELAIATFLTEGNLLQAQSYYTGIHALPPGNTLIVDNGSVQVRRYYNYIPCIEDMDAGEPENEKQRRLAQLLRQAVAKRSRHLARTVIPISGGYDSRGILACLSELTGEKLKTVTWGSHDDDPDADAAIGRRVAAHFGTEHVFFHRDLNTFATDFEEMLDSVDGMTTDPVTHWNELRIMRRIRDDMGGQYLFRGDEVFGFLGLARNEREALAMVGIRSLNEYANVSALFRPERKTALINQFQLLLNSISSGCSLTNFAARKDYYYFTQRVFNYLHRATLYKLGILEISNPWLDRDILEFYRLMSVDNRVDKTLYRRTLGAMFPELMRIPIARRNSLENWKGIVAQNSEVRNLLRFHLIEQPNRLADLLDREKIAAVAHAVLDGSPMIGRSSGRLHFIKGICQKWLPASWYSMIKAQAVIQGGVTSNLPPIDLAFRLLIIKRWADRFL